MLQGPFPSGLRCADWSVNSKTYVDLSLLTDSTIWCEIPIICLVEAHFLLCRDVLQSVLRNSVHYSQEKDDQNDTGEGLPKAIVLIRPVTKHLIRSSLEPPFLCLSSRPYTFVWLEELFPERFPHAHILILALNLYRFLRGYVWLRDTVGPTDYFLDLGRWDNIAQGAVNAVMSWIGDFLVVCL